MLAKLTIDILVDIYIISALFKKLFIILQTIRTRLHELP